MEALLLLFLFIFAAVLILLTKFTNNNELFMIIAGLILAVPLAIPLTAEGVTFDIATTRNYTQNWTYDPATLTPTNSTVFVNYSNLNVNNIYTNGLGGFFFIFGIYVMYAGANMFLDKRKQQSGGSEEEGDND